MNRYQEQERRLRLNEAHSNFDAVMKAHGRNSSDGFYIVLNLFLITSFNCLSPLLIIESFLGDRSVKELEKEYFSCSRWRKI